MSRKRLTHGEKAIAVQQLAARNAVDHVLARSAHRISERLLHCSDHVTRHAMLIDCSHLIQEWTMGHEVEATLLWAKPSFLQVTSEDIAVRVESEMLAHAVERRLRVGRRTVASASDVVDGSAVSRGDFPNIEPETAAQDPAVE